MSCDWPTVQLSDCATFQEGYVNPSQRNPEYFDGPIKWLRAVDLNDSVVTDTSRTLSEVGFQSAGKSALLFEPGSLAISKSGTIGRVGILEDFMCGNRAVINIRVDTKLCDKHFIFYILKSRRVEIEGMATGSVQKNLYTSVLGSLELQLPPLHVQREIASYLWSLDKAINLNDQINQTLEQIAQAIFKSWFVDFEPIKAKIAARERWQALQLTAESASPVCDAGEAEPLPDLDTYMNLAAMQAISGNDEAQLTRLQVEQPEQYAELLATAGLFPAAIKESDVGEIPEGWDAGTVADVATFPKARIATEALTRRTYISTENMLENKQGICEASSIPSSASVPSFEVSEILISNIRPYFKKIWFANFNGGRSPDVLGFKSKFQCTSEYLYNLLYQDKFFDYMMLTSKGAKMPRGDKKAIMQFSCVLPPIELMQNFSARFESFYQLIAANKQENDSLSSARDVLLPKLLSGELSIPGTASQVAEPELAAHV